MNEQLVIVFIRNPVFGKVKTRLARSIGVSRALEIYNRLLRFTLEVTSDIEADRWLVYDSFIPAEVPERSTASLQIGNSLGERMANAIERGFEERYRKVLIIGCDCPLLTREIICDAFSALQRHDIAIGPALDGGYYLLGQSRFHRAIFEKKTWSSNTVLRDTLRDIQRLSLSCSLLPTLSDVDTEADLIHLR